MSRKIVTGLSCLLVAGFALANPKLETKQATGAVKTISADSIVITGDGADKDKEWTFIINKETNVVADGASHTSRKAEDSKESTLITDFVKVKETVVVDYLDKGGKLTAVKVRVR